MDENQTAAALAEARQSALLRAEHDTRLSASLAEIVRRVQADGFDSLVSTLLGKRMEMADVLSGQENIDRAIAELKRLSGLPPEATPQTIVDEIFKIDEELYRDIVGLLAASKKTTDSESLKLVSAILSESDSAKKMKLLVGLFLTKQAEPKKPSSLMTEGLSASAPGLREKFVAEQTRIIELLGRRTVLDMLEATRDLLTLTSSIIEEYENLKRRKAVYDFTDLIDRTRRLLTVSGAASWVLYKLDGGIDHVLVDEAQDTSEAQWQIVKALTEEFFAGAGARAEIERTLFVVGDRKQSIFGFQGADPRAFDTSFDHFEVLIRGARRRFEPVPLFDSYRSVEAVLSAVDRTFAGSAARDGLERDLTVEIRHNATRKPLAGVVELWPLLQGEKRGQPGPLDPVDTDSPDHPRKQLAARTASLVSDWIGKRRLAARGRAVRADDILILVRNRNLFFDAVIAELQKRSVPVAGADRLVLGDHIAVQDLLSLARFVLLPEDDLSLAELLKSPLVPGSLEEEEQLFSIAHGRGEKSLWQSLRDNGNADCVKFLHSVIDLSKRLTPFEFFSHMLVTGEPSGRRRFHARLGVEADDAIDAFLDRVLDHDLHGTPSLRSFLGRFESERVEIKRNLQQHEGRVRVMTVHGAKGLEANIVMIPDAADVPRFQKDMELLMVRSEAYPLPLPFWRSKAEYKSSVIEGWKQQTKDRLMQEYRRSLYVALTRACDELYVGGCLSSGTDNLDPQSWYALVQEAMSAGLPVQTLDDGTLRFETGSAAADDTSHAATEDEIAPLPEKLRRPPLRSHRDTPWLRPTDPLLDKSDRPGRGPLDDVEIGRFRRGILIHRLLQLLPDVPEARRASAAETFLRRHDVTAHEAVVMMSEVLAILSSPEFAPYFAPGSLAEVPLVLRNGDQSESRRIDRLAITGTDIYIADFKTDRQVPRSISDTDPGYIDQLANYCRALRAIYPGRAVHAALLWTFEPRLMPVPQSRLT
jgi:ATP-dependent helicase/nuclease subunit A